MLAKANRVLAANDFKTAVRRGQRLTLSHTVMYTMTGTAHPQARFGFIVSKTVGNAVKRNLLRRRLKAIVSESLNGLPAGTDVVIRALPGCADVRWDELRAEVLAGITRGAR